MILLKNSENNCRLTKLLILVRAVRYHNHNLYNEQNTYNNVSQ